MERASVFELSDFTSGRSFSEEKSYIRSWDGGSFSLEEDYLHYGYVSKGELILDCEFGTFKLSTGMYFSYPGKAVVSGLGEGILAKNEGAGTFVIGGTRETSGSFKYIDGASDSLLIPPVSQGASCLNLLHMPPGITQTPHTHPSLRFGLICGGEGICCTKDEEFILSYGKVFILPRNVIHHFQTKEKGLHIAVFHPDSDQGPKDSNHPMLNMSFVEGVSAKYIKDIQTA